MATYVAIEEAAKRGGGEQFYENVKKRIIPRMIEKGVLRGTEDGGRLAVADDEALARVMRLGVEPFVYNQQGYSFVVVRASIEAVAEKLKKRPGVVEYEERVEPRA